MMSGKKWIVTLILSAVAYVAGTILYESLIHNRIARITLASTLGCWLFLALFSFGFSRFLRKRRERRRSA
jgi:hypothetical protein